VPDDVVLAIDVGGTKSAVALVRRDGAVLGSRRRPAGVERGPGPMIGDYVEMAREVMADAGLTTAGIGGVGVGVGCGGPLDPNTGMVYSPANLPTLGGMTRTGTLKRE
jgi:glucokinase